MIAINPPRDHLRGILADVAVVLNIFNQWASYETHNTLLPKERLDAFLQKRERLRLLDDLYNSEAAARHIKKFATCSELFASHAEPDGWWGDHTISEAEKQVVIGRVQGCLSALRSEVGGLLRVMAVNEQPCRL